MFHICTREAVYIGSSRKDHTFEPHKWLIFPGEWKWYADSPLEFFVRFYLTVGFELGDHKKLAVLVGAGHHIPARQHRAPQAGAPPALLTAQERPSITAGAQPLKMVTDVLVT